MVAGLAAVELLVRSLDSDTARVGRSLYLVGAGLALASTIWDLSVTSTLLGTKVLPSWYLGAGHWAEGLGTAYFALLAHGRDGVLRARDRLDPQVPALDRGRPADAAGPAGVRPDASRCRS